MIRSFKNGSYFLPFVEVIEKVLEGLLGKWAWSILVLMSYMRVLFMGKSPVSKYSSLTNEKL